MVDRIQRMDSAREICRSPQYGLLPLAHLVDAGALDKLF
jgi:hypothetical protein